MTRINSLTKQVGTKQIDTGWTLERERQWERENAGRIRPMADGPVDGFEAAGAVRAHPVGRLSRAEQLDAVRRMADAAQAAGVPPELPVITALVESHLNNPTGGDRDSVGMFQQRRPWGTNAQRMDIDTAIDAFINGGAARGTFGATHFLEDYGSGPLTDAQLGAWAQDVQGSAYGSRYAQRVGDARELLRDAGVAGY